MTACDQYGGLHSQGNFLSKSRKAYSEELHRVDNEMRGAAAEAAMGLPLIQDASPIEGSKAAF